MVATRAAARKQQGADPAPPASTLKAPPKRAGRKKAAPEPQPEPEPKRKRAAVAPKPPAKTTKKAAEPKKPAGRPRKAAAPSKKGEEEEEEEEPKKEEVVKKAAAPKKKAAPKPKAPARAGKRATRAMVPEPSPEPVAAADPEPITEEPAQLPEENLPEPDIQMEEAPAPEPVPELEPAHSAPAAQTPEPEGQVSTIAMPALALFPPPALSAPASSSPAPVALSPVTSSPAHISPVAAPVSPAAAPIFPLAAPISPSPALISSIIPASSPPAAVSTPAAPVLKPISFPTPAAQVSTARASLSPFDTPASFIPAPIPSPTAQVASSPAPFSPFETPTSTPAAASTPPVPVFSMPTPKPISKAPIFSRSTPNPMSTAPVFVMPGKIPSLAAPTLSLSAPVMAQPESPIKSALRSPKKAEESPKKKVTFTAHPYSASFESSLLVADGPLSNTIFYLDIKSRGKSENHIFVGLLEELGAQVMGSWETNLAPPTHVLFKEGSLETLQKVLASKGAVQCVNVGFAIDCEKHNKRMNESDYPVDMQPAAPKTPERSNKRLMYTPARTPSQFFNLKTPSTGLGTPPTPTSSEWEKSMIFSDIDDKENVPTETPPKPVQRSAPAKPQTMFKWIGKSPIKPMTVRPLASAARKRKIENFGGITMAPPKKLRFN